MEGIRERYYAISLERQIRHPGVQAITHRARELLLDTAQDTEQGAESAS